MGHANDIDAGCSVYWRLTKYKQNDDIFISGEIIGTSIRLDIVSAILLVSNANNFAEDVFAVRDL